MLLVIEPGVNKLGKELLADIKHLEANSYVSDELASRAICLTLAQLTTPFVLGDAQDVYVLAHAAYGDRADRGNANQPWIGGRWFDQFAADLWARFGASLNGHVVWFLVCHTGADLQDLARQLAAVGFRNLTMYMPTGWMYISTSGVPHLLTGDHTVETANDVVAKASSQYLDLENVSLGTGEGWNGCRIDNAGAVAPIAAQSVVDAVIVRFDEGEVEVKS